MDESGPGLRERDDFGEILERWYRCEIPQEELNELMRRSDAKGIVRTLSFLAVLVALGYLAYLSRGSWWAVPAFFAYGTVYCFLNHLMHETHHRTVFRTLWLNETVHWIAAFAHGAEPIYDRWGHTQHHTYTYHIGKDPEVVTPRPARIPRMLGMLVGIGIVRPLPIIEHAFGIIPEKDKALVPEPDWKPMIWSSRFWLLGYGLIIGSCFAFGTILPLAYTLLARFYGAFYATALNFTQHIGLEEDVYDHRLCTRDVNYGPVTSFLYWNMQYHIEHHMFPAVPFHSLRRLHAKVERQLPAPHSNLFAAYKDILSVVMRQQKESRFHITPLLPVAPPASREANGDRAPIDEILASGESRWVPVPGGAKLGPGDAMPFRYADRTYAIYRLADGFFATDGKCTHSGAILAKGLVIDDQIECPAHQGRFDIRSGKATLAPAGADLRTYAAKVEDGVLLIELKG
jgi:fatty acid desaturase/nitrite reductase/ring-hydroxylating ferredoxin subunit